MSGVRFNNMKLKTKLNPSQAVVIAFTIILTIAILFWWFAGRIQQSD